MSRYSITDFVESTRQQDRGEGKFELESPRLLEVNLNGMIWTKTGSMVAYVGQIKFERERILEKGLGKMLKKAVTGEGTRLTKATGRVRIAGRGPIPMGPRAVLRVPPRSMARLPSFPCGMPCR